jgi:hypothetical protein
MRSFGCPFMPDRPPSLPPRPPWGALSLTVFVIGLLILVPSGLCTGVLGIGFLVEASQNSSNDGMNFLMELLMFGGLPMLLGFVLVRIGLQLRKRDH